MPTTFQRISKFKEFLLSTEQWDQTEVTEREGNPKALSAPPKLKWSKLRMRMGYVAKIRTWHMAYGNEKQIGDFLWSIFSVTQGFTWRQIRTFPNRVVLTSTFFSRGWRAVSCERMYQEWLPSQQQTDVENCLPTTENEIWKSTNKDKLAQCSGTRGQTLPWVLSSLL